MELAKKFDLVDLLPEDATLKIGEKEYELRKINLQDEAWMKTQGANLQTLIAGLDLPFMAKLTFRQLKEKNDFLPITEDAHDDDGKAITRKVTGPDRILRAMCGPNTKYEWLTAIMQLIGLSRPIFDQLIEEQLKKNGLMPIESQSPTGDTSSTLSPVSMDTP